MGGEPTYGETRAERIKRKWDEGESARAVLRAEREAARQPKRDTDGFLRRMGQSLVGLGWRLLFTLMTVAVVALPALVVWALVDSDLWVNVLGGTIAIGIGAAIVVLTAGTKYSGDW